MLSFYIVFVSKEMSLILNDKLNNTNTISELGRLWHISTSESIYTYSPSPSPSLGWLQQAE